jgi:hypothetical protein
MIFPCAWPIVTPTCVCSAGTRRQGSLTTIVSGWFVGVLDGNGWRPRDGKEEACGVAATAPAGGLSTGSGTFHPGKTGPKDILSEHFQTCNFCCIMVGICPQLTVQPE